LHQLRLQPIDAKAYYMNFFALPARGDLHTADQFYSIICVSRIAESRSTIVICNCQVREMIGDGTTYQECRRMFPIRIVAMAM